MAAMDIVTGSNDDLTTGEGTWKAPNLESLVTFTSALLALVQTLLPWSQEVLSYDYSYHVTQTRMIIVSFSSSSATLECTEEWSKLISSLLFVKNFHLTLVMYVLRTKAASSSGVVGGLSYRTLSSLKHHLANHCKCLRGILNQASPKMT